MHEVCMYACEGVCVCVCRRRGVAVQKNHLMKQYVTYGLLVTYYVVFVVYVNTVTIVFRKAFPLLTNIFKSKVAFSLELSEQVPECLKIIMHVIIARSGCGIVQLILLN